MQGQPVGCQARFRAELLVAAGHRQNIFQGLFGFLKIEELSWNHNFVNYHCTWHCMHVAVTEEVGTLPPLILKSRNFPFFEINMNSPNSCRELHTIQLSTSSFHPLKTNFRWSVCNSWRQTCFFSNTSIFKYTLEHPLSYQYEYSTRTMSFTVTWSLRNSRRRWWS